MGIVRLSLRESWCLVSACGACVCCMYVINIYNSLSRTYGMDIGYGMSDMFGKSSTPDEKFALEEPDRDDPEAADYFPDPEARMVKAPSTYSFPSEAIFRLEELLEEMKASELQRVEAERERQRGEDERVIQETKRDRAERTRKRQEREREEAEKWRRYRERMPRSKSRERMPKDHVDRDSEL